MRSSTLWELTWYILTQIQYSVHMWSTYQNNFGIQRVKTMFSDKTWVFVRLFVQGQYEANRKPRPIGFLEQVWELLGIQVHVSRGTKRCHCNGILQKKLRNGKRGYVMAKEKPSDNSQLVINKQESQSAVTQLLGMSSWFSFLSSRSICHYLFFSSGKDRK